MIFSFKQLRCLLKEVVAVGGNEVRLQHVNSHSGYVGNVAANVVAKCGVHEVFSDRACVRIAASKCRERCKVEADQRLRALAYQNESESAARYHGLYDTNPALRAKTAYGNRREEIYFTEIRLGLREPPCSDTDSDR